MKAYVVRGWHGVWELHLSARVTTRNFCKLLGNYIIEQQKYKQTIQNRKITYSVNIEE